MDRQFRFVTIKDPTQAPSAESKKVAYSHAFRQAHATRRREQTEKYRREMATAISKTCPPSPLIQAISSSKDVFSCLPRPLSPAEYNMLNNYVHVIVPFTVDHCVLFNHPGDLKTQLLQEWVSLAITDDALMTAVVLLGACRYILRMQPGDLGYTRLALQYKQTCLHALRQEMNRVSAPSVVTVAKAIALAIDDVMAGELTIARKHVKGVLAMVNSSGGTGKLGMSGLLERMYQRFIVALDIDDAEIDVFCTV